MRRILLGFLSLVVASCAHVPQNEMNGQDTASVADMHANEAPLVVMIGVDGLRWDAIDRHNAPTLQALAQGGMRPQSMIPVMPTKTFVNFYTLATGLYPEHHGIVTNAPYDRSFGEGFVNQTSPGEARWWGGEPIWVTAEQQDVRTGVMFWLGSEAPIKGVRPTEWRPFDQNKPYDERVEEVLGWLARDGEERPGFVAFYMSAVDTAAHRFGPESDEEGQAIALVDQTIASFLEGLEALGLRDQANIIIVSDHGMTHTLQSDYIYLDDYVSLDGIYVPELEGRYGNSYQPFVQIFAEEGGQDLDTVYDALNGVNPHMHVYRRDALPETYHFNHPDRGADLFVEAELGRSIRLRAPEPQWPTPIPGTHGYDNREEDMHATFIGNGPAFPVGERPDSFENVNVYLMIACILGLTPAETDGDEALVESLLTQTCPSFH